VTQEEEEEEEEEPQAPRTVALEHGYQILLSERLFPAATLFSYQTSYRKPSFQVLTVAATRPLGEKR